jgi:uncharacterized protein YqgC (DUF456 family)
MTSILDVLVTVFAGLFMLIGLVGTVLPLLPDVGLIWFAALGYGLIVGWGEHGLWFFGGISLLGFAGLLAELWVSGVSSRKSGASILSFIAGVIFGVIGLLVAGPFGAFGGLLLGTFVVEYFRLRDPEQAVRAMLGVGLGCGVSVGVKLLLGISMVVIWVAWVVTR